MDSNTVVEGTVKFRDGKKWKSRWCVMRKLSPVADCLHLQLYRDSKDRYKQGQTKASLSLQHFLGVQSGFTLDKESNTIAIICQDVTVVLAFDTRERLIQWQVKIANNLGEDEQFLVQIQSAPSRGKIAPGPARLHIQEHQFSLTVGVPPRLVGFWQIGQLRRYGVVENRFCFEGGSRCGRGEGLYVLVTDQGQDIARAFLLAAEGKLHTRRRHHSRTALDSPSVRRRVEPETEPNPEAVTWPSCETRPDCDYGDTASVSEQEISVWTVENNMERCMSCISKLGAMSRSSTMAQTPGSGFSPAWTMETNTSDGQGGCGGTVNFSSTGSGSQFKECWPQQESSAANITEHCQCCHSRYAKPLLQVDTNVDSPQRKRFKPPMPLPSHCTCQPVGPYSNYDVPKSFNASQVRPTRRDNCCSPTDELYDTPKHLKESLMLTGEFTNYDRPPPSRTCGCPQRPTNVNRSQVAEWHGGACPCHRVMSWMSLPFYCRRGYGRENTALPPPVKFDVVGNTLTSSTMPIYATIDRSKKTRCRLNQPLENDEKNKKLHDVESPLCDNEISVDGYERSTINFTKTSEKTELTNISHSYMNLEFSKTLGLYENSKDVLTRVENAASLDKNTNTLLESQIVVRNGVKYCSKCGHTCNQNMRPNGKQDDYLMMEPSLKGNAQAKNMSSPLKGKVKYFPGYLPMHPVPSNGGFTKTEFLKYNFTERNGLSGRAASSPSLTAPSVDRSRKPKVDHSISASSSPYLRRRLRNCFGDGSDEDSRFSLMRRRSNSADSARYIDDLESITERTGSSSPTQVNNHESSKNTSIDSLCSQSLSIKRLNDVTISNESSCSNIPQCTEEASNTGKDEIQVPYKKLETAKLTDIVESSLTSDTVDNPVVTVQIKRSSSVPCKPGHNRDSSSSNDSGVSLCSLRQRGSDFAEFELPLTTSMSTIRHHYALTQHFNENNSCFHASLPRRSKSSDLLRELSFKFQDIKIAPKSSSAEAEVPICLLKKETKGGFLSPSGVPYIDSRSTSSGTSDMSDYIETLSLSSYSSSDTPESLRFSRTAATTLRPRSGKEYHKIDRYFFDGDTKKPPYTIIPPVGEKSESTSCLDAHQAI